MVMMMMVVVVWALGSGSLRHDWCSGCSCSCGTVRWSKI